MNHTLSESQLEAMIKSAVNSSGPLPPDEKFSQLISALRELQERRKAAMDSEPVAYSLIFRNMDGALNNYINTNTTFSTREKAEAYGKGGSYEVRSDGRLEWVPNPALDPVVVPLYRHAQPAPVVPDDVLEALQKVARIRLDLNDFDGDRRGIADCLGDAEEALIEVVNRRAAMLSAAQQEVTNGK
ncbi:TPA: hypothetical protein NQI02_001761 [Klebsiella variicola]|nr:hypothetical protein [Klebsiella variicola]